MLVYTPQLHVFLGLSAQSRNIHCECTICTSYLLIVKSSCSPTRPLSSYPWLGCLYIVLENQLTSKRLQLTHPLIHSLGQRCVCFVQWRQKQQQNTVAHEGHLSHTHAARTPTEDSNLVTCFFVIKRTNRKGWSTCYGCFSQPLYLYVCVMCMHMFMFRCARACSVWYLCMCVHTHGGLRLISGVLFNCSLPYFLWQGFSFEPRAHWLDSAS